jgi:hypothetical protein
MRQLLAMQCSNGLMHESVDVLLHSTDESAVACTRDVFEWANAMLVTLVEQTLGLDCDAEAQRLHIEMLRNQWGETEAGIRAYNTSDDVVGGAGTWRVCSQPDHASDRPCLEEPCAAAKGQHLTLAQDVLPPSILTI